MSASEVTLGYVEENLQGLLAALERRGAVLRDMTRGVAGRFSPGFYLHGPAGTAKTHTVRAVLDQALNGDYVYRRGHLTPIGLFELLQGASEEVVVLDDVGSVFTQTVALQVLLAALEQPRPGRERRITYKRKGSDLSFPFRGGVVAISNLELHDSGLLGALKSRVNTLRYDPPPGQLAALMLSCASGGLAAAGRKIAPEDAEAVARHVIAETLRLGLRMDLRVYFDKALPAFVQHKDGETECHWRDLVTALLQEQMAEPTHEVEAPAGRAARIEAEERIAREIYDAYRDARERARAWEERTGKSTRAFYRRLEGARGPGE